MHCAYRDIRCRIPEEPTWFDEHAVPRYLPFHPHECANIYARDAALLLIRCQACGHEFLVANSCGYTLHETPMISIIRADRLPNVWWGDPPNVDCCAAGPTMSCDLVRVVEFWRNGTDGWQRDHALEVPLDEFGRNVVK